MLVAMVVLVLVLAIIFNIFGQASQLTDSVEREGDSANEARQVLDRIATDVGGMIIRPDVDEFFYKSPGNDKMFFYSSQAGYYNALNVTSTNDYTPLALVGYRVSTNTPPVLQRLVQGVTWDNYDASKTGNGYLYNISFLAFTNIPPTISGGVVSPAVRTLIDATGSITNWWGINGGVLQTSGVPVVGSSNGNYDDGTSPDGYYDSIGSQVFRMEICFQQQGGSFTTNCPSPMVAGSITNTTAVVVAIAVLDLKSRKLMTTQAQWTSLIGGLQDLQASNISVNPPMLMDALWNSALKTPIAGVPALAQSHVKVYQRYYYLNAPKYQ